LGHDSRDRCGARASNRRHRLASHLVRALDALVSVLSALHDRWRHAYDPLNPLPGPSDWHQTSLQLEPRLREGASRTGCTVAVHRSDIVLHYPDDKAEWTSHVESDITARAEHEAAKDEDADSDEADSDEAEGADRG
jgi:hypothetical protein